VFCCGFGLLAADDLLVEDLVVAVVDFFAEESVFFTLSDLAVEVDLVAGLLTLLAFGSGFCVLSEDDFAEAGLSCAVLSFADCAFGCAGCAGFVLLLLSL